ncbi:MAG: hypothetical protein ABR555_05545 [Pyrinomonadaceae bacterium]
MSANPKGTCYIVQTLRSARERGRLAHTGADENIRAPSDQKMVALIAFNI